MSLKNQRGQVLLVAVLVIIVGLTVGLSLVSRSITNLRTSTEEAESQKALAAAEAGIERAIQGGNISVADSIGGASYSTTVEQVNGTEILLNGGNTILNDEGIDLWLSDYNKDVNHIYENRRSGTMNIYWGESTVACDNAALEIIVLSGDKNNPKSERYATDPCLTRGNNFSQALSANKSIGGKTFYYTATISILPASPGLIARVIPIYGNTTAGATGIVFPNQGFLKTATGTSGEATRKIGVFQGWPQTYLPYLSYGLFVAR